MKSNIFHRIRPRFVAIIFLALLPIVYFHPAVKGDLILLMGDGWSYSLPMRMLLGEMISLGIPPLWNPHTFAGTPFLATIQPGALYPPNWLFAVFPPGLAMNIVVITTYHLALVGTYCYARTLDFDRLAALVAAVTFSFGGFFISHLEQLNYIASAAWLPLILMAIERLRRNASWRWVMPGAVFIALQCFAGLPQATWQILIVIAPYWVVSLFGRVQPDQRWRFLFHSSAMAVCGFLLSAIQLLPAMELQQQGERAQIDYETFSTASLPLRKLFTLVFPYFFGGGHPPLYRVPGWDEALKLSYAYVGFPGLLLGLIANLEAGRRAGQGPKCTLVRFWTAVAAISLVMSFGSNLPFELNRLFYQIPINNLFRGPDRHLFEFTFALAMLAGFGLSYLRQNEWRQTRRAVLISLSLISACVIATAAIYRFFGRSLGAAMPQPPGASSLTNPEAFVPLACFVVSVPALLWFARHPATKSGIVLLAVLLADLALFGQYTQWRSMGASVLERLPDPPAIAFIKSRERDLHSFRVLNYAPWPYGPTYEDLNHGNLAIARGVESVTGYDPMRLIRPASIAGEMDIFGVIRRTDSFGLHDQGFNLLNVKYLLRERASRPDASSLQIEGIRFSNDMLEISPAPGIRYELETDGAAATEIALVTTMTDSAHIRDDAPVARIRLRTKDGRQIEHEIRAGCDTAEWAYDRADVKASARHRRAPLAESWAADGFEGHRYLARFAFDRAEIEHVEIESLFAPLETNAKLLVLRASLHDATTGDSTALDRAMFPAGRWRRIARFGRIDVLENLRFLPRAWFVERLVALPGVDVPRTIREGSLADGAPFDPARTALAATEDLGGRKNDLPAIGAAGAKVNVTRYEPMRIELQTRNEKPGFLVLSEIYYRGWEAKVDGKRVPVERVNHTLRGIAVPAGDHRIEFFFRAPSFWLGAKYSVIGLLLLLIGGMINRGFRNSPAPSCEIRAASN
ncbi:MAG: YfhO family protein [Blastocatellia bacterium]